MNALSAFADHQTRRNLRHGTIKRRTYLLKQLERWLAPIPVTSATAGDIDGWLSACNVSPQSRSSYLSNVHAFYVWAIDVGLIDTDPTAKLERPKLPRRLPRPAATCDFADAVDQAEPRMLAWLLLAGYAGLRCHEIAGLRRGAILDRDEPPALRVEDGKGGHQRVVPLHPDLLAALLPFLDQRGWLFPSGRGNGALSPSSVSRLIVGHFAACGIHGSAHPLRHWFATNVYRASGKDLRMTQELLGHADPKTTAVYTLIDVSESSGAVASLSLDEAKARHPTAL